MGRNKLKAAVKTEIFEYWQKKCAYCGESLHRCGTLDHVVPRSKGGATHKKNLIACCFACNISKSSRPWLEWFREQEFWEPFREDAVRMWLDC